MEDKIFIFNKLLKIKDEMSFYGLEKTNLSINVAKNYSGFYLYFYLNRDLLKNNTEHIQEITVNIYSSNNSNYSVEISNFLEEKIYFSKEIEFDQIAKFIEVTLPEEIEKIMSLLLK